MTSHIFQEYSKRTFVHELKEYCTSQGLPICILMVLDNPPAHPHVLQDLHQDIKFVFLPPTTTSWCLELARKVGLDELEEDVDSLLEMIGKELSTEELDELEKQWCQLEEEVEAEQHPMAPSTTKQLTVKILQCFFKIINQGMDYLEEVDPDFEQAGLTKRRVMSYLAHYKHLLYEKSREATQAILDAFFSRVSLPEASVSEEPHTSKEPHISKEPLPSTSTGDFTCLNVPSPLPSSSDVDDPGVV